jgi:hypothetical protein
MSDTIQNQATKTLAAKLQQLDADEELEISTHLDELYALTESCKDADWSDPEIQMYVLDLFTWVANQSRFCDEVSERVSLLREQSVAKKTGGVKND